MPQTSTQTAKTYSRPLPNWITKTLVEEYENIRESGQTNMFDFQEVIRLATARGLQELPLIDRADYPTLLSFYSQAMETYRKTS